MRLRLTAGVPTAVGSGRAGLLRKLHALIHSARLVSPSWAAAVRLLNSTFSFCRDLGVESGLTTVRIHLRDLMGQWAILDDQDAHEDDAQHFLVQGEQGPDLGHDAAEELGNFNFEAEPEVDVQAVEA